MLLLFKNLTSIKSQHKKLFVITCMLWLIFLSRTFASHCSHLFRAARVWVVELKPAAVRQELIIRPWAEQSRLKWWIWSKFLTNACCSRQLFPLIFRCAYWLCHRVEGSKSPLKLENNYSNFSVFCCQLLLRRRCLWGDVTTIYNLLCVTFLGVLKSECVCRAADILSINAFHLQHFQSSVHKSK